MQWEAIRHSYKFHLLDDQLASRLDSFFFSLNSFRTKMNEALTTLRKFEKPTLAKLTGGFADVTDAVYLLSDEAGNQPRGTLNAAIFFEENPAEHRKMTWVNIQVPLGTGSGGYRYPTGSDAAQFFTKFKNEMESAIKDDDHVKDARILFESVLNQAVVLQNDIGSEISSWASTSPARHARTA
jgi:hypothetical protein